MSLNVGSVTRAAAKELRRRLRKDAKLHSPHEGYAKLLEELDELKLEVWMKQGKRSPKRMRKEAVQVAATAMRFCLECCDEE
jgi:hypothetical protein